MSQKEREILNRVLEVPYWRHQIPITDHVITPGRVKPRAYEALELGSLDDCRVLDIGAWDGLYSFLAERNGAEEVVAMDVYEKSGDYDGWWDDIRKGGGDLGIRTAKELLNSDVKIRDKSVYELDSEVDGEFDVVMLPAVLYHLKKPMLALERIRDVTNGMLAISTVTTPRSKVMEFHSGGRAPWWEPSPDIVPDLLTAVGFRSVNVISDSFRPFKSPLATVLDRSTLQRRGDEHIIGNSRRIRIFLDGDKIGIDDFSGKYYIEIDIDGSPVQGWVGKDRVLYGYKDHLERGYISDILKSRVWQMARAGRFGTFGRRKIGAKKWIVAHGLAN